MQAAEAAPIESVSIIVPNVDGGERLLSCLESAAGLAETFEVILVDNGSRDGSQVRAVQNYPEIRLLENTYNTGFAHACNQGAAIARGQYLLFLNNDARLSPDALRQLVATAEKDGYQILQPVIVNEDGNVASAGYLFTWTGFLWHQKGVEAPAQTSSVFTVKGACMLIERGVFEALGGFRASYFAYFEEADLCWRARMAGFEVGVTPLANAWHEGGATTRRVLEPHYIYYLGFRNRLRSILSNPSAASILRIIPVHFLACLATAACFACLGRVRDAGAILKAMGWPARHFALVKQERRMAQSTRKLADAEVLRAELTAKLSVRRVLTLLRGSLSRWR